MGEGTRQIAHVEKRIYDQMQTEPSDDPESKYCPNISNRTACTASS